MPHPQQLRDSIRSFLAGVDQINTPEMARAADDFADACRLTNDRLRRCLDFLRRGHRSEAIHLAEAHPNLLDVSTALDIAELPEWEMLCAGYGWARPPRILVESAQELNEAYALEQELQPLLLRHRRLAMEEAPLSERLGVLRELIKADPTNPGWDVDVCAYERVRLRELRADTQAVISKRDVRAIDRLWAEVTDQPWRAPVSADIRTALETASVALHREQALQDLRSLLPQLHDAYAAMSYSDCKRVVARWCSIVSTDQLSLPPELREEIRPVNNWLAEQDDLRERRKELQQACDVLRRVMDVDAPVTELQLRYREAKSFELDLPEDVEREYAKKLKIYEQQEQTRRRTLLIIMISLAVTALIAIWIFYRLMTQAAKG